MQPLAPAMDLVRMVRARDYRRFIAIQLAPVAVRRALYAVTAFAIEIAEVPEKITEPLAGFMRFAWWREALEEIEQGRPVRQHPVLIALAALPSVPFAALHAVIEQGQHRLEDFPRAPNPTDPLDEAWRALLGAHQKPLAALALLPADARVMPLHILRVLMLGLKR